MRNFPDWIKAFLDYTSPLEAPRRMYFWTAISTIAGALRRRVWIGGNYFRWYPNFYVILVAPPGIVSKSTTASVGMNLLRQVPGIQFGPDVITWQALVTHFAEASIEFQVDGGWDSMAALTISSSEFGNLLDPHDRAMVDMLITLWDCQNLDKKTKTSGEDAVRNSWLNIIACTTPTWIAGNFPEYLIGGGFTSRCVFIYAEEKEKLVAHPWLAEPPNIHEYQQALIADLEHISSAIVGRYELHPDAVRWGEAWYEQHWKTRASDLEDSRLGGYIARKQTHIYKLAQVLTAATTDDLEISKETLSLAEAMVTDTEQELLKVFNRIGKSEISNHADKLVWYVQRREKVPYVDVYRFMHQWFPSMKEFEDVLTGCIRAGLVRMENHGGTVMLLGG